MSRPPGPCPARSIPSPLPPELGKLRIESDIGKLALRGRVTERLTAATSAVLMGVPRMYRASRMPTRYRSTTILAPFAELKAAVTVNTPAGNIASTTTQNAINELGWGARSPPTRGPVRVRAPRWPAPRMHAPAPRKRSRKQKVRMAVVSMRTIGAKSEANQRVGEAERPPPSRFRIAGLGSTPGFSAPNSFLKGAQHVRAHG